MSVKEQALKEIAWEEVKKRGSDHYKTGAIEPIDLYRSLGILRSFCIASIIKYAARNVGNSPIKNKDMDKISHYAEILKVAYGEQYSEGVTAEEKEKIIQNCGI
jgi:hypothetical protein